MKIVGLIAEYNPFHNGHQYHIEKAKKLTGADFVIVVMSGNFVQRGAPAIMPKHLRTEAALRGGASLVIELPVCYATASAELFAFGAVSILHQLGCVDAICFGSECGDIHKLSEVAEILANEPAEYKEFLQSFLKSGDSFPLARQKALFAFTGSDDLNQILGQPNNILGVEYLKALKRLNSSMEACTITRISSNYHDTELQEQFSSASAIRNYLNDNQLGLVLNQLPENSVPILEGNYQKCYPVFSNDFSLLLKYQLLRETKESLLAYADMSEELANRILNQLDRYESFDQFCDLLKTKEMTYTRISRSLLHVVLQVKNYASPQYARVLGFQKDAASIFSEIKKHASIPLISKLGKTEELSEEGLEMLEMDIFASNLYETVIADKFKTKFRNEYEHPIVRI